MYFWLHQVLVVAFEIFLVKCAGFSLVVVCKLQSLWSLVAAAMCFSWPMTCGIFVTRPEIKPAFLALEAWTLNHWTTRKVSEGDSL